MRGVQRHLPTAWALALAVLMLGPALGRGYVLTYDMVWVPDLALRSDFLGSGTALPRAVPSDAVVAVLDEVVPGMLLQKVVLLGLLVLAGAGAAALVGPSLGARLVAVSVAVWNPYVVERLLLGQWTLLLGYAALPWVVHGAIRVRTTGQWPRWLLIALLVGSTSASAGIFTAFALLVLGWSRRRGAGRWLVLAVLAVNAPWVVAGMLSSAGRGDTATALFGLHGDALPAPLAALELGGIWNLDVVPSTRLSLLLPTLGGVAIVAAAVLGGRRMWERLGTRTTVGLGVCWAVGYVGTLVTWAAPSQVDDLAGSVPGIAVLRDGTRALVLCVPLLVCLAGAAWETIADWCHRRAVARGAVVALCAVAVAAPVALLPDAAWGVSGTLRPAAFPDDWADGRAALGRQAGAGDVLVLPFSSYRAPTWNRGRVVIDPLGRYLQRNYVASDVLVVDRTEIPGADRRVPKVAEALTEDPDRAAVALGRLGIGFVALEKDAGRVLAEPPAGAVVFDGPTLRITRLQVPVTDRKTEAWRVVVLGSAWAAYVGAWVAAAALLIGPSLRRRSRAV